MAFSQTLKTTSWGREGVYVLWAETEQTVIIRTGLGSLPPNKILETSEEFRGPRRRANVSTCGQWTAVSVCQGGGSG